MAPVKSVLLLLVLPLFNCLEVFDTIQKFDKVTDFALEHHAEINFDGLLGFVLAEAQLLQVVELAPKLRILLEKCEKLRSKVILPRTPNKMIILEEFLLHPESWVVGEKFVLDSLEDLGIYQNWTVEDVIKDKRATYKGVPSDHCLMEILGKNCYVSSFCKEMMLASRIDKGYLLTHRLLYLQVIRLKQCPFDRETFREFTRNFCSLILRETRTNDRLGFPAHDIALEQMVLCGIEGYTEFLNDDWRRQVLSWQTPSGCYKSEDDSNSKRSSNIISFGCSDHSTGLGAAALALNLRFQIQKFARV